MSALTVSSITADVIKPKSLVVGGNEQGTILLEKNPSAPFVSQPIIGQANDATQYLRLFGTGESTAFIPQFFTTPSVPSTIGHLGADVLYLGPSGNTWASIRASANASTIIMSGGLNVSTVSVSTINGFPAFPSVVNRASFTSSITITASTFATAQTVGTVTLSTLFAADVDISAIFTAQTTSAGTTDVYYYCTQGGISVGTTFIDTIQGNNHYSTCPAQATSLNLAPSTYTFGVKVYTPNGAGDLVVTPVQIRALGNLL
jgi:hypothetical protein